MSGLLDVGETGGPTGGQQPSPRVPSEQVNPVLSGQVHQGAPEHAAPAASRVITGQVDSTRIPRYAGPSTFAQLPRIDEVSRADVAVLGVPFDSGVSYRPGARFGPSHIRAASTLLRPYNPAQDVLPFGV